MTLSWEIDVYRRPIPQIDCLLPGCLAIDPRFKHIVTRGKPAQSKSPIFVCGDKIGRVQNENETAHVLVNIAAQRYQPWGVENLRRDRPLIRPIASQIEAFGR